MTDRFKSLNGDEDLEFELYDFKVRSLVNFARASSPHWALLMKIQIKKIEESEGSTLFYPNFQAILNL